MNRLTVKIEDRQWLKRFPILRGVAEKAEAVEPFQYYTEPGERIYCIYEPNQSGLLKKYFHFDAKGNKLASFGSAEDQYGTVEDGLSEITVDEVEAHGPLPGRFVDLLRDMHLAAAADPAQLYKPDELTWIRNAFPDAPVIIGGCGRSGTTLLLSMLATHRSIFALPDEAHPFYPYPFRLNRLWRELEQRGGHGWKRWCEKTPKNVRAFGHILDAFNKDVRLIHIVRDGREVVTSHHPNHEEQYWVSPERWVADVQAGLNYQNQSYLVKYEDLVREPRQTMKALCEFIGEIFEPEMLEPEKYSRIRESVAWKGRRLLELNSQGIGRWNAPEHENRVREFLDFPGAIPLMQELGYL